MPSLHHATSSHIDNTHNNRHKAPRLHHAEADAVLAHAHKAARSVDRVEHPVSARRPTVRVAQLCAAKPKSDTLQTDKKKQSR
eukprot:363936-Chlamydomonas_euryale.AAC.1